MTFKHHDVLKTSPYFDDFQSQKDFLQILFKPGVAVQARELTQLQTLLQNQISKLSDHIFKDGSQVFGASLSLGNYYFLRVKKNSIKNSLGNTISADFTNLSVVESYFKNKSFAPVKFTYNSQTYGQGTYSDTDIQEDRAFMAGALTTANKIVQDKNLDFQIKVVQVLPELATDDLIIVFKFTKGSLENLKLLSDTKLTEITKENWQTLVGVETDVSNANPINFEMINRVLDGSIVLLENTNTAIVASVTPGIFYKDGRFVNTDEGDEVLYKLSVVDDTQNLEIENTMLTDVKISVAGRSSYVGRRLFSYPTKRLGFDITTQIIDYQDDLTLLDNAIGSYNEKAPGADRLKIVFTFVSKDISITLVENYNSDTFVEIGRTRKGLSDYIKKSPDYADILKLFAQRTYDESGSYTVRPFLLDFKQHLRKDTFTLYGNGTSFTNIPEVGDLVLIYRLTPTGDIPSVRYGSPNAELIFPSETKSINQKYPTDITTEPIGIIEKVNFSTTEAPNVSVVVRNLNTISFSTLLRTQEIAFKSADDGQYRLMMTLRQGEANTYVDFNLDSEGVYDLQSVPAGDESKFVAKVSSGKAYIEGFPYESLLPKNVIFDKARTTAIGDSTIQASLNNIIYLKPASDTVFTSDVFSLGNVFKENITIKASEDIVAIEFMGTPADAAAQGTVVSWSPFKQGDLINLNTSSSVLNINNKESVIFVSGQAPS